MKVNATTDCARLSTAILYIGERCRIDKAEQDALRNLISTYATTNSNEAFNDDFVLGERS